MKFEILDTDALARVCLFEFDKKSIVNLLVRDSFRGLDETILAIIYLGVIFTVFYLG